MCFKIQKSENVYQLAQECETKPMKPKVLAAACFFSAAAVALFFLSRRFPKTGTLETLFVTALTFAYHLDMRLLVGLLVRPLTPRFNPRARWFRPRRAELRLYRLLRVRHWRGRIPTYDPALFDVARVPVADLARNMCCAEAVHAVIAALSYVPLLFIIPFGAPAVFLITSVLSSLLDCVFVIVQRANRPSVLRLLDRLKKKRE